MLSKQRVRLWSSLVGLLLLARCSCPGEPPPPPPGEREAAITEHTFPPADQVSPTRALGEDCSDVGSGGCESRLCLRIKGSIGRAGAYVCSKHCTGETAGECPEGWWCRASYPGTSGLLCVPRGAR